MASQMRYRSGVVRYVALPTNSSYPIELGDLVGVDSSVAKAASSFADSGTAAQNRAAFAAAFAGVAAAKVGLQTGETSFKLSTDPGYILVGTSGVWAFDCASTSWVTGELVGVYNDATDNSDQQVAKVTEIDEAIGVAEVPLNQIGDAATEVLVDIRSAVMRQAVTSGV